MKENYSMKKILIFILCTGSTVASANPCRDSVLEKIGEEIHSNDESIRFNQEQISSYRKQNRLYRNLSVVLKKMKL